MAETNTSNGDRTKSPMYPAANIEECLSFIRTVDSLGGKIVSYDSILDAMGLKNRTTKSFINPLSTAKQFGLVATGRGSTVQLTEKAQQVLYPTDRPEREILKECFREPPLYAKLIERFEGKALPSETLLSNILMNDYGLIKTAKDKAAKCFLESAQYLGVAPNGVLLFDTPETQTAHFDDTDVVPAHAEEKATVSGTTGRATSASAHRHSGSSEDYYNAEIPTMGGQAAIISIPRSVTPKDLDFIEKYIKMMIPDFISNLKEEINKVRPEEVED